MFKKLINKLSTKLINKNEKSFIGVRVITKRHIRVDSRMYGINSSDKLKSQRYFYYSIFFTIGETS